MEKLEDRIRILEEKHEYQDHTVEQLNQVIIQQQDQIDRMQAELVKLREVIISNTIETEGINDTSPHY